MGHPYRDQVYQIPPLPVLLPLAVVDTLVVELPTAPWMCQPAYLYRMLLAPVVGLAIGLMLGVQTVLWHFLGKWWTGLKADADAAFATVPGSPPEVSMPEPTDALAAVFVEWVPNRFGRLAWFDVYVDDRPVWTVTGERLTPVITSEGQHRIFIKVNHMKSDEVELDLAAGGLCHLVCGMNPLIQNRFFRFFNMKFKFVAIPVALVCFFVPAAMLPPRTLCGRVPCDRDPRSPGILREPSPVLLPPAGCDALSRGVARSPRWSNGAGIVVEPWPGTRGFRKMERVNQRRNRQVELERDGRWNG